MSQNPPQDGDPLPDDAIVTQYGNTGALVAGRPFKNHPPTATFGLSVIVGKVSVEDAWRLIDGRRVSLRSSAGVRYARAESFAAEGLVARYAPTSANSDHGRVVKLEGDWDASVDVAFDRCFSEPVWWQN